MDKQHPFEPGDLVCHINQEWARAERIVTARVTEVKDCGDGTFEYQVDATQEFSRRPSKDNPMTRPTWWNSRATHFLAAGIEIVP